MGDPSKKKYHLHIDLTTDYEPTQKKNKLKQYTCIDIENMRVQGRKHLDIGCDGRVYPKNPITNNTPNFSSPSSLLRFTGDGHNGLLGYCNALSSQENSLKYLYDILCIEVSILKAQNHQ